MDQITPLSVSYSLNQIQEVAQQLFHQREDSRVFTFEGNLGAGKTTLIRALCRYLGVPEAAISSPTFSIINEYLPAEKSDFQKVYHMDWYRLRNEEEAFQAGVEAALQDPTAVCLIEWPQQAAGLLTMPYFKIIIEKSSGATPQRTLQASLENFTGKGPY